MQKNKEFLTNPIGKQKDCEFSLRFLVQKEKGSWKNFFTMIKLVKKGARKEINYDYGEYVLGEKLLDINNAKKMISGLYPTDTKKGYLVIPNYGEFRIESISSSEFVRSSYRHGLLKNTWPFRFLSFYITPDQHVQHWNRELLKERIPYFPTLTSAVISFFELPVKDLGDHGRVYVVIPDYRARIESLKLIFSRAELNLVSPEIKYEDLVVKVFAKSGARITTLPDIYPKSEIVKFDIGFQPDMLSVALVSRKDNMKIDVKEFSQWSVEEEGVFVERPEEEILSLTKAGESQNLEYKPDILDENKRNDFIETVVAFLNTNRGIILIGLDDNGSIIGSKKTADDIQKMIHDCCEPPPKDIRIEEKIIAGNKMIIVEVPEGNNKPYQSKIDRNWYVRHNANDMKMERSELFQIVEEYIKGRERPTLGY